MSITNALLAGVSGLVANSAGIAAVSQNIANVNSVGYKDSEASFETLVNGQGQSALYDAGGVIEQTKQLVTQQGTATQTNSGTDLSISGQGFFVVSSTPKTTSTTSSSASPTLFTRAGSFTPNSSGYLQNSAGLFLEGWPVNANGQVATDPSNLNLLQSINVNSVGGAAEATTSVSINANLNSGQALSAPALATTANTAAAAAAAAPTNTALASAAAAAAAAVNPADLGLAAAAAVAASNANPTNQALATAAANATQAEATANPSSALWATAATAAATQAATPSTSNAAASATAATAAAAAATATVLSEAYSSASLTNSMAAYNATTGAGVKPDYSVQIPISDSQGGEHTIQVDFLKSSTPNQWYAEIVGVPASNITNAAGLPAGQIASGVVAFTPGGQLDPTQTTLLGISTTGSSQLTLGSSNAGAPSGTAVNWASGLGISGQTISLNLSSPTSGLTQDNSTSATQSITTNGTPFGNVQNVEINPQGVVTAVFDNGTTRQIAQVAVATFPNADGLSQVSGNAFQVSQSSGTYNLKVPGTGGAGLLSPSTLEASTVDLSTEFANLIVSQNAYSASSKIITTADRMMQELVNIIQ